MMNQGRQLEGKVAIVTGASRGIGAAIAANLASKGCFILMNYTSDSSTDRCSALAQDLSLRYSVTCRTVQADIGSPQAAERIIAAARMHFMHPRSGNLTIHIVVNNAGIASNLHLSDASAQDLEASFHKQYAVNVLGPLLLIKACMPYLPTDGTGRVINLSSVSASLGFPGQSVYGGTKAALEAMTRSWSRELGGRATVNSINPGPVATDMYGGTDPGFQRMMKNWNSVAPRAQVRDGYDDPEVVKEVEGGDLGGRAATAAEIAGVVSMLVNPESGWCTGSVICANGGMRMSP